mmetsp:Transcript_15872/g.35582  ORF Transcript_15872/g.35582 Transcript_15872/m.35582 type:complete len:235 (-) Transcript_15872:902-1606(-)
MLLDDDGHRDADGHREGRKRRRLPAQLDLAVLPAESDGTFAGLEKDVAPHVLDDADALPAVGAERGNGAVGFVAADVAGAAAAEALTMLLGRRRRGFPDGHVGTRRRVRRRRRLLAPRRRCRELQHRRLWPARLGGSGCRLVGLEGGHGAGFVGLFVFVRSLLFLGRFWLVLQELDLAFLLRPPDPHVPVHPPLIGLRAAHHSAVVIRREDRKASEGQQHRRAVNLRLELQPQE